MMSMSKCDTPFHLNSDLMTATALMSFSLLKPSAMGKKEVVSTIED